MIVYGIDPATHCGWSVFKDGEPVACGTWTLKAHTHSNWANVSSSAYWGLENLAIEYGGPQRVVYELVPGGAHKGGETGRIYAVIVAAIQMWCETVSDASGAIPFEGIPIGTWKKAFTGKGNAGKDVVMAEAKKRWPHLDIIDDNAADACGIAWTGSERIEA